MTNPLAFDPDPPSSWGGDPIPLAQSRQRLALASAQQDGQPLVERSAGTVTIISRPVEPESTQPR